MSDRDQREDERQAARGDERSLLSWKRRQEHRGTCFHEVLAILVGPGRDERTLTTVLRVTCPCERVFEFRIPDEAIFDLVKDAEAPRLEASSEWDLDERRVTLALEDHSQTLASWTIAHPYRGDQG